MVGYNTTRRYASITVRIEDYERLKRYAKRNYTSLTRAITKILDEIEGAREGQGLATVPPPSSSGGKGGKSRLVEEGEG